MLKGLGTAKAVLLKNSEIWKRVIEYVFLLLSFACFITISCAVVSGFVYGDDIDNYYCKHDDDAYCLENQFSCHNCFITSEVLNILNMGAVMYPFVSILDPGMSIEKSNISYLK